MKNYCNKCKKIDSELPVLIDLSMGTIRYSNLRMSAENSFLVEEKIIFQAIGKFPKNLALCGSCFISFFDYIK